MLSSRVRAWFVESVEAATKHRGAFAGHPGQEEAGVVAALDPGLGSERPKLLYEGHRAAVGL